MKSLLEKLSEQYDDEYISYLIEKDIDYNCEKGLYEKGFMKAVKKILNKYSDNYWSDLRTNCWGNRELNVEFYDSDFREFRYTF